MPTMMGHSRINSTNPFGVGRGGIRGIQSRIADFQAADLAAQKAAAKTATLTSRSSFKRKRDIAPVRPGRSGTGGKMTDHITWARLQGQSSVALKIADLDKAAPHWIIQEIGTAEKANIMRADEDGPKVGRVATIRPQKGRVISSGLMWASNGRYSPPNRGGGTENLFPRIGPGRAQDSMVIRKEIEGQHFIKKGAEEGFREYRSSVLAAARRQLRKKRTV